MRPSLGPLASGPMWNVYVILAIFERVMQVDLYPTAFLIPLLIPKEDEVA